MRVIGHARRGRFFRSLCFKGIAVVVLPAIVLVCAAGAMFLVQARADTWDERAERAASVQQATSEVLQLLTDVETGVRGYAAVGDPVFLEPEEAARVRLPAVLGQLHLLTHGTGSESLATALADLALQRLEVAEQLKAALLTQRVSPRRIDELLMSGKLAMDRVRVADARLLKVETSDRLAADAEHHRSVHQLNVAGLALLAIGLSFGIGGAALLMGSIVRRVRIVEQNARALADGLPLTVLDGLGLDEIASMDAALRQAAQQVSEQRHRLNLALEVGGINVWTVDRAGRMTVQGSRGDEYGDTHESALQYFNDADAQLMRDVVAGVLADGSPRTYEIRNRNDGRTYAGRAVPLSESEVLGASVDVTAIRRAELLERRAAARTAAELLEQSERRGLHHAAIFGSVGDGIVTADRHGVCTSINPAACIMLGFAAEEVIGQNLHALIHHSHADGTPFPAEACDMKASFADETPNRSGRTVMWRRDGSRLPVAYSVAPLRADTPDPGVVLTFVDATVEFNTTELQERAAADLRRAVCDSQLVLHYQPKVDLKTGRVSGVEALVRWQRGSTLVMPDEFIAVAEATGVIAELTDWVLDESARQAAQWRSEGLDVRVAVNLSGQLLDGGAVQRLLEATQRHALPASQLEIEITESSLAGRPEAAISVLSEFAAVGVRCALDDFGTGHSSLARLKHLPVAELKIDKSFVRELTRDRRDQALVAATVQMAKSLGMTTTAEGVEDGETLAAIQKAGCDAGQGYHWARPLPADRAGALIAEMNGCRPSTRRTSFARRA